MSSLYALLIYHKWCFNDHEALFQTIMRAQDLCTWMVIPTHLGLDRCLCKQDCQRRSAMRMLHADLNGTYNPERSDSKLASQAGILSIYFIPRVNNGAEQPLPANMAIYYGILPYASYFVTQTTFCGQLGPGHHAHIEVGRAAVAHCEHNPTARVPMPLDIMASGPGSQFRDSAPNPEVEDRRTT